jgi:cytochrome c oxidase subunit IV
MVVTGSAVLIAIGIPMLWWWHRWQILGLIAIIVPTVVVNALITAVLSESDSRYQSRVIWLIPLTAGLILTDSLNRRRNLFNGSGAGATKEI